MILISKNTANQNNIISNNVHVDHDKIKVGMCGTKYVGSDEYPIVVVDVISDKRIVICNLLSHHMDKLVYDINEVQILPSLYLSEYLKINNNYYAPVTYSYRKNKRWMPAGSGQWETCSIVIGRANEYRDPSF